MKTEKEIKEKINELKTERKNILKKRLESGCRLRSDGFLRLENNLSSKTKILEWVLESE